MEGQRPFDRLLFYRAWMTIGIVICMASCMYASPTAEGVEDVSPSDCAVKVLELDAYRGFDDGELESAVWIFAGRASDIGHTGRLYCDRAVYCERLGNRSDFFVFRNDSLVWTGYHTGRSLGMLLHDKVDLRAADNNRPRNNGSQRYTAVGKLDVNAPLSANGIVHKREDIHGIAVTAYGDTINDVYQTRHTDDIIIHADLTTDSDTITRTVYRWYSEKSPIPFALQCDGILYVDTSALNNSDVSQEDGTEKDNHIKSIIDSAQITRDGETVTVHVRESIALHVYIMDIPGNIYGRAAGTSDNFTIDISGLAHNRYIVSILSDAGQGYTRRILLDL